MAIEYREATSADVPSMEESRAGDVAAGPPDPRMARYLDGEHHPSQALRPRGAFVAVADGDVVGYIGGHLTRRYDCDGELQYLYVSPSYRRAGVATGLLDRLARWFERNQARRVCVDVVPENSAARSFYSQHGAQPLAEYWMVWDDIRSAIDGGQP